MISPPEAHHRGATLTFPVLVKSDSVEEGASFGTLATTGRAIYGTRPEQED